MRVRLLFLFAIFITLPLAANITGVVINTDGQPVAGAKVSIYVPETIAARRARFVSKTPDRTALATTTTDSKGTFSFDSPKEQPVVDLRVEANGFAPDSLRVLANDEAGAIALTAAAMKQGTITANGKPVAGATVAWLSNASGTIAVTDAAGHYSVPDPSKWANRVLVVHPDYAILDNLTGPFRSAPKVDQTLTAGVAIKGRVVAENGQTPVAKAAISVDDWPVATTADDGSFTIPHAARDWQDIQTREGSLGSMRARAGEAAVNLRLARLGKVTGTVQDAKTRLPLAGAEVRIGPANLFGRVRGFGGGGGAGTGAATDSVITDAKGAFTITAPSGQYNLSAIYPGSVVSNATISVSAGQTLNKPLYGSARARVSGTVVDEEKRAVAGAHLAPRNATRDAGPMMIGPRFTPDATAFSGPDGRFVLRNVVAETEIQVDASKKGLPSAHSASLRLNPGEKKTGLTITIPRGVAFTGKVTDGAGRPVSGVGIEPVEAAGGRGFAGVRRVVMALQRDREDEVVRTGSDGTFNLRLKEGTYDVVFKREGFATKTLRAQAVSASSRPVEVKLDPGVEISGRVVRSGVGVEGVNVTAIGEDGPQNTVTSSDGAFTITDLSPGQMMLNVNKMDAFIQQMRPITAPARDVVIQLPTGGTITGRVVDKSSHAPVTSFQAGISNVRSGGGMVIAMPPMLKTFTSDDGTFTLENVPPGPTQLVVNAAGYTTTRIPSLNVEDGKTLPDVEVAMDTGGRLSGRVTGPDGSPLSGVSVREAGSNMGPARMMPGMEGTATTDPNGEYTIDAVDPGQQTFTFSRQGYMSEERTVTISGRDSRLDVTLTTGMTLTGIVVTDAGVPVADAIVGANSASDASFGRSDRSDAGGNFTLTGLAPGHYTLSARKQGLVDGILRDFDLSAGAPARIIMKSGGTIMGHVTGLSDADLQNTTVTANGPNGGASGEVDSTGSYRIDGAPIGTVRVSARTGRGFGPGGKSSPVQSVQVDAGSSVQVDIQFKSSTVITGRITRNGQPLPNVMVMFNPRGGSTQTQASGTADSSGTYSINGLDDGSYNVGVLDIDRSNAFSSTYDVHGSGTFDIDIKTASLRGTVVDSSSGEPLGNAQVQLQSGQGFFGSHTALTDPSGAFFLDNVASGSYQVTAQKDGYGHDVKSITIGNSPPDDLAFKLSPSGGVTLHVVDGRDNRALSANVLHVVDAQGRELDNSGGFRFNASPGPVKLTLSPGTYSVTLSAMGYAPKVVSVTSPIEMTVQMLPGGSLVLRSKSSSQQRVRLIDPKGSIYPRGQNGIFMIDPNPMTTTINNISGGSWTLQVLDSAGQVVNTIPITVVDGQQNVVDV
jgi:large repetitive protein